MKTTMNLMALLAFVSGLGAQTNPCPVACSSAANFSVDSYGPVDTRQDTWGHADYMKFPVTFKAPVGHRVRILGLRGDLVSWPKVMKGETPVQPGSYAGVLLAFSSTAPDASVLCTYCADGTMLYIQDALTDKPVRTPFNDNVEVGGLLEADHVLIVKVAQWLNTTGYPIHMEPTFTVTFRFEPETQAATESKSLVVFKNMVAKSK